MIQPAGQSAIGERVPSPREFVADGVVHAIGIVAGIVAAGVLLAIMGVRGEPREFAAVSVYAGGLVAVLGCSAAYNLARSARLRELFRRFDHAAIFALIAGTYTPFTVLRLDGAWADGLTALVWSVAAVGIALKLWRPDRCEPCFIVLYLALGWVGLIAFQPLLASVGPVTFMLLVVGGLLYSVGVIFHVWERLPFQRAVWHGFVLAAAGTHYAAVVNAIVLT